MTHFEPIAIVGRACVLPGATHPSALWDAVSQGRDLVTDAPEGRWGVPLSAALVGADGDATDRAWSQRGGYVRDFERVWNPKGFAIPAASFSGLDPVALWSVHTAREAWRDAALPESARARCGAIFGNLGFPSAGMAAYAQSVWLPDVPAPGSADPRNRFMASGPASLVREAMGLGLPGFCLDAACASSLYAIKLACDRLHTGAADVMLAGAVQAADDLFLHVGFTALRALSKSGRSRPFHAEADGLLPAEGAGFVVLERLVDARAAGRPVLGVIRGVGLSNDGRGKGILAPSASGQARAIAQAYALADVAPEEVSLLECHATGTQVGDATEVRSSREVFGEHADLPIGSLKSNCGHLITSAGVGGLIKVIEAMRHGMRPPSLHADEQIEALRGTPFRVLTEAEPWACEGPKIAGVSAFGFGGNNAHLVVSEDDPSIACVSAASRGDRSRRIVTQRGATIVDSSPTLGGDAHAAHTSAGRVANGGAPQPDATIAAAAQAEPSMEGAAQGAANPESRVAIVGAAARWGDARAPDDVLRALHAAQPARASVIELPLRGLRFPPKDLQQSLAQQNLLLEAALSATTGIDLPPERTGVFIGMEPDAEVARYGARWRLAAHPGLRPDALRAARDGVVPALTSAAVVGTMPNIPANRLSSQFDLHGPAFVVCSGGRSGLDALDLAIAALDAGEIDVALVGAVALHAERVHEAACRATGRHAEGSDGAVLLVLRRSADVPSPLGTLGPATGAPETEHPAAALIAHARHGLANAPRPTPMRGPTMSVVAHAPPVPSLAASAALLPSSASLPTPAGMTSPRQHMAPAPALPSVMAPAPPLAPSASVASQPSASPAGTPQPVATQAIPPERAPIGPWPAQPVATDPWSAQQGVAASFAPQAGHGASYLDQLAVLQHAHFAQQTAAHVHFLAFQQQAAQMLLQRAQGAPPAWAPTPSAQRLASAGAPTQTPPVAPTARPAAHAAAPARTPAPGSARAAPRSSMELTAPAPFAAPAPRSEEQAAPASSSAMRRAEDLPGLKLNRAQLEVHSGGKISEIYGPEFAAQDDYARQVRMPLGRLLLADRVIGLDAEPCTMKTGTIWTETDVTWDKWYLNHDRMPAGILIESGQADLMLISYLGVDLLNRSERVYRLLGCELTYHGDLPRAGETLQYDIHLDGHAKTGDVRLMFFHYDCIADGRPQLSVRGGQAGFFTDEELDHSAGCLWTPEEQEIVENPTLDPAAVPLESIPQRIDDSTLRAFADGEGAAVFGSAYGFAKAHNRTPTIQSGDMQLLDRVVELDATGGPWGRGYMRGELSLSAERWFYDGHFLNDPCMPGTLMFEGCLQAMAIYLAAMGHTLAKDGWRFQPKPETPFQLSCRGQAVPRNELLTYEVFVEEIVAGPTPTLYADLLCTVDGLKAFHARRVALELVPDWPLEAMPELLEGIEDPVPVAEVDGFRFGYASMLACAWGKPSDAFGPMYAPFDGPRRVARLPGPPYHFMTRVTHVEGPIGVMEAGAKVRIEYDVPEDAWYFRENKAGVMPFAVLLEAALQPCGWLASYVGSALTVDAELGFRNLDGTGTIRREIGPGDGTLVTDVTLKNVSATGGMIIQSFDVACTIDGEPVYDLQTVFGFFPPAALANQAGLSVSDAQRELQERPCEDLVDLTARPAPYWDDGRATLADPMLLMLDRVTGIWPSAGAAGLGQYRGAKVVDQGEWFFKAHFFQDPVQPGSLGLEALIQLLQFAMLDRGLDRGIENPHFEAIAVDDEMSWKYRGQVLLHNKEIESTLEILSIDEDDDGVVARAKGSLWIDGKRIYEAFGVGMRITAGPSRSARFLDAAEVTLDPARDTWLLDHCPTYTRASLPMMHVVDAIASADSKICGVRNVRVTGWILVDEPRTLRVELDGADARVVDAVSGQEVASAKVVREPVPASAPAAPLAGDAQPLPYEDGTLFHGSAFRVVTNIVRTSEGTSLEIDAKSGVPAGRWNPALLDAGTHGIPHDGLHAWFVDADPAGVAYPALVRSLDVFGPAPVEGRVRCEVRPEGWFGDKKHPQFRLQWIVDETTPRVWAEMVLVEAVFPKGPLGSAPPPERRAFLRDRAFTPGVGLTSADAEGTRLEEAAVHGSDWLPGTIRAVYGTEDASRIAAAEHIGRAHELHPRDLPARLPLQRFALDVTSEGGAVHVRGDGTGELDIEPVRAFWTSWFAREPWPVEDLYYGLIERFVERVVLDDARGFAALLGRPTIFLANHETALESLVFSIIASAMHELPTVTVAKAEHRYTWLGKLIQHCFAYPGVEDPKVMTFFDRADRASLPKLIGEIAGEMAAGRRSAMVHVEGTRAFDASHRVVKMSGAFIDMAIELGAPVVPVRFTGGLPLDPLQVRTEFPVGYTKQTLWFGRPLWPEELRAHPYGERKRKVIDAINGLGDGRVFAPGPHDEAFSAAVRAHQEEWGVDAEHAALALMLSERALRSDETRRLLSGKVRADETWLAELRQRLFG